MTPEERYTLQQALYAAEEAASALRRVLDPGPNRHINAADYKARLAAQLNRCRCEFGWDPDCPQHRDSAAYYLDPARGVEMPVEDHQGERPRDQQDAPPCRGPHPHEGQCFVNPAPADHRPDWEKSLPGVANALAAEQPLMESHRPTPRDVFGKDQK